jgi:tetratricopeptide (TPR) repeat protein
MIKLRLSKKVWVTVGTVVLLITAAGAGFLIQMLQHRNDAPTTNGQNTLPASLTKVENLISAGKTEEAQQELTAALNNSSTSNEDKYLLYNTQANLANDRRDYNAVIDALLKADAIRPTPETASGLGAAYQELGDKAKAIEYYRRAIERNTDQTNPMRERQGEMYAEMIRNLGGQP